MVAASAVTSGHHKILIDTNVWLYHLGAHPQFGQPASALIGAMEQGSFEGVVSELTLMELQVRPLTMRRRDIADQYELLLDHFPHLNMVPVSRDVLNLAASLRARYRLKTPDAIILSCGIRNGATLAVSNDQRWQQVKEISTAAL
jgi:predicted nucleic acid-binding protein